MAHKKEETKKIRARISDMLRLDEASLLEQKESGGKEKNRVDMITFLLDYYINERKS